MFRNMTVGKKIITGFGLLLAITMALGGIGAWNMVTLAEEAGMVSQDFLPQIKILNQIETKTLRSVAEFQTFLLSGDEKYYNQGTKIIDQTKKLFQRAQRLAAGSAMLSQLRSHVAQTAAKLDSYQKLAEKARAMKARVVQTQARLEQALERFLQAAGALASIQEQTLRRQIQQGAGQSAMFGTLQKLQLSRKLLEQGRHLGRLLGRAEDAATQKEGQGNLGNKFALLNGITKRLKGLVAQPMAQAALKQVQQAGRQLQSGLAGLRRYQDQALRLERRQVQMADAIVAGSRANLEMGLKQVEAISGQTQSLEVVMFIGLGVALVVGILLAWIITRGITRPLGEIITGLGSGAQQVAAASEQVSSSAQQLASGASQQAASLEETSSSLEEITSMTKSNADNAGQADTLMTQAKQAVQQAGHDMGQMATAFDHIARLGGETGKIVKAIDEIAFQTNLLALNAAVEAARAGEAGAGFAVVADEVRNLAMRAAEAAKSTQELVDQMVSGIEQSADMVARTQQGFQEVSQAAEKVAELVSEIAAASGEQAQGVEQINLAVSELDKVTQANAANAEQGASASEQMNAMATTMQELVNALIVMVGGKDSGKRHRLTWKKGSDSKRSIPSTRQAEPEPAALEPPRRAIPLEEDGDFSDF